MVAWALAPSPQRPEGVPIHGCRDCGGVWIDTPTLTAILRAASAQAPAVGHGLGPAAVQRKTMAAGAATAGVVYKKCPGCGHNMLRKNFARISGVLVDECRAHGTFFDAGELEAVLDFVRSGGLAHAQQSDADEKNRLRRVQLQSAALKTQNTGIGPAWIDGGYPDHTSTAFLSFVGRWVRDRFTD